MKRFFIFPAAAACLLAVGAATAAHPGYVDLERLDASAGAAPTVAVSLDGWLMELGGDALEDEDLAALRGLEALSVRVYESASDQVALAVDELAQGLQAQGWTPVVRVRDGADDVSVLLKSAGEAIAGLTVLVRGSGGEAVFVNAYGEIRPEDLGRMLSSLGALGEVDLAGVNVEVD